MKIRTLIDELKAMENKEIRIFGRKETYKTYPYCVNIIEILEELEEYEIDQPIGLKVDEYGEVLTDYDHCDNTYNSNGRISNDIDWKMFKNIKGINDSLFVFSVHYYGDVRGNYSHYMFLDIPEHFFYEVLSENRNIDTPIDDDFLIDCNCLSEMYTIYNKDGTEQVEETYDIEEFVQEQLKKQAFLAINDPDIDIQKNKIVITTFCDENIGKSDYYTTKIINFAAIEKIYAYMKEVH